MTNVADAAHEQLQSLIGLKLSASYRAADMRMFHFGTMRVVGNGAVGEYALHVQCPWRLDSPSKVITGRHDLFEPAKVNDGLDLDSWDWNGNETLKDRIISSFLSESTPVVKNVATDSNGGAIISFSQGYRLVLFPSASRGEDWRFFRPKTEDDHFVVCSGRVEENE